MPVTVKPTTDLNDAISNSNLGKNCNPVVWASLVQQYRQQVLAETARATAINNQLVAGGKKAPMNNDCTTNLGPNGEKRKDVLEKVRDYISKNASNLICSLNWSTLLGFSFSASLNICKGGKLFSGGATDSIQNSFLVNGTDPTKSKDCVQSDAASNNLLDNVGNMTTQITKNPNSSAISFNNGSATPAGSGSGSGWGIIFGGSTTKNNNGTAGITSGTTSSGSTTSTSSSSSDTGKSDATVNTNPPPSTGAIAPPNPPPPAPAGGNNLYK